MTVPVLVSWSGGKDSTLALHELLQAGEHSVAALLTTVTRPYDRISMHGVQRTLLVEQALSLGFPLETVEIGAGASNADYEAAMGEALARHRAAGVRTAVFGDLYLEDIRRFREAQVARIGMDAIFPLWGRDTTELAHRFLALGYRAVVVCVDSQALDREFVGREFDEFFLRELPPNVDPCGENGEFHTFVYDGPIFRQPVRHERGEIVLRDQRFYFCDLLPAGTQEPPLSPILSPTRGEREHGH